MVAHSSSLSSDFPPGSNGSSAGDPLTSPGLSSTGHALMAACLGFILFFGCFSNLLVLLVFARFRALWTPINVVLLNISASDALVCVLGTPFSFASSVRGRWLLGLDACRWYGFANSLFGIVSLVSLSVLSYERYVAILQASKPDRSDFRRAWHCVAGAWLYSLAWTLPPFLGWSSYGPEGSGTTCSVQWHQQSASSISYVVCLFIFCLLLPLLLMVYCYGKILLIIKGVTKINLLSAQRRENHILLMVMTMVSCYLLCWMPYGVVSLMATFGRQGLVTPVASVIPSVLAKSSTVINPVIYVLFNNQFYRCFVAFVKCEEEPSTHTLNLPHNSREEAAASCICPTCTESAWRLSLRGHCKLTSEREHHTLSLVVHYTH
ncbi:teleost multiple tissue opsin 3a [Hoplias malabaricus]|uniref:teleost multiple tissue opsin 3a n=1 Tax=Hoplias malabaricus TaxID=27720 RepID=UPI0034619EE3